jgi:hypothetical protein
MKKIIGLFVVLSACAAAASAATLGEVCGSLSMDDVAKCYNAAGSRVCDPGALDICKAMSFPDDAIRCVGTVAGREYKAEEIQSCKDIMSTTDQLQCLASAGRIARDPELRRVYLECRDRFSTDAARFNCVRIEAGF